MDKAQEHGFVCKSKENDYGTGIFCAYAARDYKGKKEGNIWWQAFPPKEVEAARNMADKPQIEPRPPIRLDCDWKDLFGSEIPENHHRNNWEEWKRLALNTGEKDLVNYWTDTEACQGCKCLDRDWCLKVELPCTVNPYLTLQRGLGPGMGMGRDNGIN
jgi:hypothetical protein